MLGVGGADHNDYLIAESPEVVYHTAPTERIKQSEAKVRSFPGILEIIVDLG